MAQNHSESCLLPYYGAMLAICQELISSLPHALLLAHRIRAPVIGHYLAIHI
jgi:hypothetical protein